MVTYLSMYRIGLAADLGTSDRSGQMLKGIPNPVCPVVKDFLLKWVSDAICSPVRSTEAATTWVDAPALIRPLVVPVRFPPPALVQTTTSGSLANFSLNCIEISYPSVSTPAMPKGVYKEALKYPVSSKRSRNL